MKKPLIERFQKLAGIKSLNKLTEQPIPDKDRDDSIYTDPNPDRPGYVRPTGLDKPGDPELKPIDRPPSTSPVRRMCCPEVINLDFASPRLVVSLVESLLISYFLTIAALRYVDIIGDKRGDEAVSVYLCR